MRRAFLRKRLARYLSLLSKVPVGCWVKRWSEFPIVKDFRTSSGECINLELVGLECTSDFLRIGVSVSDGNFMSSIFPVSRSLCFEFDNEDDLKYEIVSMDKSIGIKGAATLIPCREFIASLLISSIVIALQSVMLFSHCGVITLLITGFGCVFLLSSNPIICLSSKPRMLMRLDVCFALAIFSKGMKYVAFLLIIIGCVVRIVSFLGLIEN